jgi:hypothetical protein
LAYSSRHERQSDRQGGLLNRRFVGGVATGMLVVMALTTTAVAQAPLTARSGPGLTATVTVSTGTITGTAWKGETSPYPQARIRLRNVHTGRAIARTDADSDGRFHFLQVDPAPYVVELVSEEDKVLAVGDLFSVTAGNESTTLVRLASKTPWLGGFFGNAAAAVISAASTLGVTAAGSSGRPASVQ